MNEYNQCDVTFLMVASIEPCEIIEASIQSIIETSKASILLVFDPIGKSDDHINKIINLKNRSSRLVVVLARSPNQGLTKSLNQGLEQIATAITSRIDPGDYSSRNRLQITLNILNSLPNVVVCGCKAILYSEDGRLIYYPKGSADSYVTRAALSKGNPLAHGSISFLTKSIVDIGGYDDSFRYSQDYELYERITRVYGDAAIMSVSNSFYRRVININAVSYIYADEQTRCSFEISKRINKSLSLTQQKEREKSIKKRFFALGANGKYKDLIFLSIRHRKFILGIGYVIKMMAIRNVPYVHRLFY